MTVIAPEAKPRGMSFREFVETPGPIGGHGSMGGLATDPLPGGPLTPPLL